MVKDVLANLNSLQKENREAESFDFDSFILSLNGFCGKSVSLILLNRFCSSDVVEYARKCT